MRRVKNDYALEIEQPGFIPAGQEHLWPAGGGGADLPAYIADPEAKKAKARAKERAEKEKREE